MPANHHATVTAVDTVTVEGLVHPARMNVTTVTSQMAKRDVSCDEDGATLDPLPAQEALEVEGLQEQTSGDDFLVMIVVVAILTSPTLKFTSLAFQGLPGVKKSKTFLPKMVLRLHKS